jgi:hypothetical protein
MLYLPSSKFSYCCSKASEDGGSWYSSKGSASTHDRNAQNMVQHTHTCKQGEKIRNSTTLHKVAHKTIIELFYALQRSQ